MADLAEFRSAPVDDAQVVWVAGELDASNASALTLAVKAADRDERALVVVDLSAVSYLDSSAVQALIVLARGGPALAVVAPPTSTIRRTLEILGIDQLVPVHASVRHAVRAQ